MIYKYHFNPLSAERLRPTRVEPRLHCVDIAWQVRGRCVGSAAYSPLHAIAARALSAARAIEPRPTHFARVRALCVGPRISRGLALFAARAHALISSSMQFSTHSICDPSKSRPILSKANTIFYHKVRIRTTSISCHKFAKAATFQNFAKYRNLT